MMKAIFGAACAALFAVGCVSGVGGEPEGALDGLIGPDTSEGVRFEPMAAFPLEEEIAGFGDVALRASILTIAPGGRLRLHDHFERPAFSWILAGTPIEARSDRAMPVNHEPGSITREFAMAHYWTNPGDEEARLLVIDMIRGEEAAKAKLSHAAPRPESPDFEGPDAAFGATVAVQGAIRLAEVFPDLPAAKGRIFRARRIDLRPGAYSHVHRHENAPSFTFVAEGTVREHRSDQAEPDLYGRGEIAVDRAGMAHWWEVVGDEPVVFLVGEIVAE